MKRFTLFIVATLLTTLSFAQKPVLTDAALFTPPTAILTNLSEADDIVKTNNTARKAPKKVDAIEVITELPTGVEADFWTANGSARVNGNNTTINKFVSVAFDGNDVYIGGLNPYNTDPVYYVKGTLDGNTLSIPSGFYWGNPGATTYFVGYTSAAGVDAEFTYDADTNTFTLGNYILVNSNPGDSFSAYAYYFPGLTITAPDEPLPDPVTAPAGLVTEDMPLEASENGATDYSATVKVGWEGNDVYIQGFNKYLPEAWIKGTLNVEDNIVSFPIQYMGRDANRPYFLTGYSSSGTLPGAKMEYSADDNTFTGSGTININSNATSWSSIVFYNGVIIGQAPEPITVPDGLVTESYPISATDNNSANYSGTVEVGIDGTDIYFKNLLANVPDAWVKGTIADDGTVTIPIQYAGKNSGYGIGMYAVGYSNSTFTDIVLQYYAEYDVFVAQNVIAASAKKNSRNFFFDDDILQNAVIGVPPVSVTANTADETTYYATFYDADFNYVADADTKVYTAKVDESGEWMNLSEVANKVIPAGTAVILEGKAATITLKGSRAAAEAVENNDLKGAAADKAPAEGVTTYVLANGDAGVGFYQFAGATLAAGKAYIEIAGDAAAKVLTFGETTAINGVADVKAGNAVIYNLAGQRVNNAQKGVFIQNGKKVVF
ncbi:MAG: hypothetical protein IJ539_01315 [Prevotella sp.]|nr:hypothetical protein [Prevotella sp.]